MSGRIRVWSTAMIIGAVALSMAACGTSKAQSRGTLGTPSMVAASSPASAPATTATPTTPPATSKPATPPIAKALTCAQTKWGEVGSATISYNGYHDSIPLGGGVFSGEDGSVVTLQKPCGIGDLTGDSAKDAVGVIMLTTGGTGQFYTLVVWKNVSHKPVFWALADLGDRNPVLSVAIAGQVATVQYCTRTADAPMVELNITRTATYRLSGHTFSETGHTDEPGECHPS
jgi:hypothetical protein